MSSHRGQRSDYRKDSFLLDSHQERKNKGGTVLLPFVYLRTAFKTKVFTDSPVTRFSYTFANDRKAYRMKPIRKLHLPRPSQR